MNEKEDKAAFAAALAAPVILAAAYQLLKFLQTNNPASAAAPAGFLIRKHSTVLLCEEVRPGTSRPGLHFYCSMIPLRTQSDKKESPAALYDRAAGARWGICLSENNHRIRKHAC